MTSSRTLEITYREVVPGLAKITINGIDLTRSMVESLCVDHGYNPAHDENVQVIAWVNTGRKYTYYMWTDDRGQENFSSDPCMGTPVSLIPEWELLAVRDGALAVIIPTAQEGCTIYRADAPKYNVWLQADQP